MWTDRTPSDRAEYAESIAQEAAEALLKRIDAPRIDAAFVMGSGWKEAADGVGEPYLRFPVTEIPGFLAPTAAGHAGEIRAIRRGERCAVIFAGRTHLYEGHGPLAAVHGVRTAIAAGANTIVLTNACGSLTADLPVGAPALISDHINFTAQTPLIGARFVDLTDVYSPRLRAALRAFDATIGEGVYGGWFGPAFETPAEIRMMKTLGVDLVGMSTVLEAIAAREGGAEVLGLSLVTNRAAGLAGTKLSGEEVLEVANAAIPRLRPLLTEVARLVLA
ncbi:MAG: purine-nucleoside phosphorylase [Spirochaetaceae bacterium]|nr:MAG: purine-nucleoside phosphorylase [Spirochaetaceae bacterium]